MGGGEGDPLAFPSGMDGLFGPQRNKRKDFCPLWPNRYSLQRFPYESFETPNEHENLIRFPGKDFVGLEFKADSLNLLRSSPWKDLEYILRTD